MHGYSYYYAPIKVLPHLYAMHAESVGGIAISGDLTCLKVDFPYNGENFWASFPLAKSISYVCSIIISAS